MRCLLLLAKQPAGVALSLADIAEQEHLPRHYAMQIMHKLRQAGLIKSTRGTQGGFALGHEPSKITVGSILRVLEGVPFEKTCAHFNEKSACGHLGDCSLRPVWETIAQRLWDALDRITLDQLSGNESAVTERLALQLPILSDPGHHPCP